MSRPAPAASSDSGAAAGASSAASKLRSGKQTQANAASAAASSAPHLSSGDPMVTSSSDDERDPPAPTAASSAAAHAAAAASSSTPLTEQQLLEKPLDEKIARVRSLRHSSDFRWARLAPWQQVLAQPTAADARTFLAYRCRVEQEIVLEQLIGGWRRDELRLVCRFLSLPVLRDKGCTARMQSSIIAAVDEWLQQHSEIADEGYNALDNIAMLGSGSDKRSIASHSDSDSDAAHAPPVAPPTPRPKRKEKQRGNDRRQENDRRDAELHQQIKRLPSMSSHHHKKSHLHASKPAPRSARALFASPPPASAASSRRKAKAKHGDSDDDDNDDDDDDGNSSSSSSSSSTPSSDSSDDDRAVALRGGRLSRHAREDELDRVGVTHSDDFHVGFIRNALRNTVGRSVYDVFRRDVTPSWGSQHEHSRRECLVLAMIIDEALLHREVNRTLLDLACRRLGGVHTAVDTGSWKLCERLQSDHDQRNFVPEKYLARALKRVTQETSLHKVAGERDYTSTASSSGNKYKSNSSSGGKSSSNRQRSNNNGRGRDSTRGQGSSSTSAKEPRSDSKKRGSDAK